MKKKIGISAAFFHPDWQRNLFKGKRLLYYEQSMIHWLQRNGQIAILIPNAITDINDYLDLVDAVILPGGADVAPKSYGQDPLQHEWQGDVYRDHYELEIFHHCLDRKKPVLGICRGLQIINIAFGGSLYQDIHSQHETNTIHRDGQTYDKNFHEIEIYPQSILSKIYQQNTVAVVNSIHHQAIREIAEDLTVEAVSKTDGIIEAVSYKGKENFIYAVQWHPEFLPENDIAILNPDLLLNYFIANI